MVISRLSTCSALALHVDKNEKELFYTVTSCGHIGRIYATFFNRGQPSPSGIFFGKLSLLIRPEICYKTEK